MEHNSPTPSRIQLGVERVGQGRSDTNHTGTKTAGPILAESVCVSLPAPSCLSVKQKLHWQAQVLGKRTLTHWAKLFRQETYKVKGMGGR